MRKSGIRKGSIYAALVVLSAVYSAPFVWMLIQSLKTLADYYRRPPAILVANPEWSNYFVLLSDPTFLRATVNSLLVAAAIATLQVLVSSLAAFAFAALQFNGKTALFTATISTLMVPSTATIVPLFMV